MATREVGKALEEAAQRAADALAAAGKPDVGRTLATVVEVVVADHLEELDAGEVWVLTADLRALADRVSEDGATGALTGPALAGLFALTEIAERRRKGAL